MKDDSSVVSKSEDVGNQEIHSGSGTHLEVSEAALHPGVSSPPTAVPINGTDVAGSNGEPIAEKSDSEAETVVLPGKEEDKDRNSKKTIKLEETSPEEANQNHHPHGDKVAAGERREDSPEIEVRKSSLKRKRAALEHGSGDDPDGANSSNLSSTISSPVQEARSSRANDTASNRSRSSPPSDEVAQAQGRRAQKARTEIHSIQNHSGNAKSDRGSGPATGRKRRDTRSATHYDELVHRSESPPSRNQNRAQSIQSNPAHPGVTKRRRAPAPLHVERRRKASVDTHPDSEDDSSVHSHHHLLKLNSTDSNAMSPAKMVSHKKNRDRNGRTLLARACQQGEVGEVEKWLKERRQDINVADNAGNTPLQIAALDGTPEVVQLLLDAGCDIDCKNIDRDTPLIDAVENGHLEVVKMLLKAGLDPRQPNAFGKEPLDLVRSDDEHTEEIREALQASKKEKALLRRPSDDSSRQQSAGSRDLEATAGAGSGTSPINNTRSPPPVGLGARRRTARSQPTDDALLWVNATPARLRDAAGKGDLTIVDHILKMRPQADTEALIAAARGGHEEVLSLMLAIADPNPDPEPLKSGGHDPAQSTPMLGAIGHGNPAIINLLVTQRGFDPTRRLYKGMTYHEIAKERQGTDWQEEYDILKEAFDNHKQHGGRRSNNNSPRKVRPRRADSSKSGSEPSSSPHEARRIRKPSTLKEESIDGVKHDSQHENTAFKHRQEEKKQRSPGLIEPESLGPPKSKAKEGKLGSDKEHLTSKRIDNLKPKRRLVSGNDFKTDQDMKRRASLAAEADLPQRKSSDSFDTKVRRRRFSDASESKSKVTSREHLDGEGVISKKRHRLSVSPEAGESDLSAGVEVKGKKRQRVNSQGNAVDQDRDRSFLPGPPAVVAHMITSPVSLTSPTVSQGTAPVAFMGSTVPTANQSPTELRPHLVTTPSLNSIDQTLSSSPDQQSSYVQNQTDGKPTTGEAVGQGQASGDAVQIVESGDKTSQQIQANEERQAQDEKADAEHRAQSAREEAEKSRLVEARLEELRKSAETERQIRLEKEQEENRLAKLKRDEDMQQRRTEQERLRKEEQERRRRELEERETLHRLRMQENEERYRLQSLPNGLRRAAELPSEVARKPKEITKWLPLRTVTTQELDPSCEPQIAEEKWIANIQAAPILTVKDLDLSQCGYCFA